MTDLSNTLELTELFKGAIERHWIFRVKATKTVALERYWSYREEDGQQVSAGWYRRKAEGRTLELQQVPKLTDPAPLLEWCKAHGKNPPIYGHPEPHSGRQRSTRAHTARAKNLIRAELTAHPKANAAKLARELGVSYSTVYQIRRDLRDAVTLLKKQQEEQNDQRHDI